MAANIIAVEGSSRVPFLCTGNVVSGAIVVSNLMFGVAIMSGSSGDTIALQTGGIVDLPKLNVASGSMAVGAYVYWDATNGNATVSATSNTKLGVATIAANNTVTTVRVKLNNSF